ncbi:MAG: amidohydrolase family protein [Fimbriimonas sp.]|nr:amidohydrolase family protein [Fimbriimonas sp.]
MSFRFGLFTFALGLLAPVAMSQTKDIVINGASIETGDGAVISTGSILIHDGKILSVGPTVDAPAGAEVVDGKGWFIYPGFIDAYCTEGLKLPSAPVSGTPPDSRNTAPASMWHANRRGIRSDVVAADCLDLKSRVTDSYAMGVTTALLASDSGSIRGTASVVDYLGKGSVLSRMAVESIALKGGGFGGGGGGGYPGTLFGVTALTRQILADAQTYSATEKPAKDASLENLRSLVKGEIPALFIADTAREIVRAQRIADEFDLKWIVQGGREAYRELDLLKKAHTPVILSLDVPDAPTKKAETGPDATPEAVLLDRYETWKEHSKNAQVLDEAGIPLAFGLGSSFGEYLDGVRKIIAAGLPRSAALKAMTSGAAAILGVSDRIGVIQPGHLANLVIMSGDFAADKSTILSVFVEGKRFDMKKGGAK